MSSQSIAYRKTSNESVVRLSPDAMNGAMRNLIISEKHNLVQTSPQKKSSRSRGQQGRNSRAHDNHDRSVNQPKESLALKRNVYANKNDIQRLLNANHITAEMLMSEKSMTEEELVRNASVMSNSRNYGSDFKAPIHELANLHEGMMTSRESNLRTGSPVERKNRMVEMTTIKNVAPSGDSYALMLLSDPSSTTTNRSTRIVRLPTVPAPAGNVDVSRKGEPVFSRKVFVGGLPIDVTEEEVWATFAVYGKVLVDWPRRPEHCKGDFYEDDSRRNPRSVSGYVFLVFDKEESVQELVRHCVVDANKYYLFVSSPTMNQKPVQVRPWRLSDIDYFGNKNSYVDPRRTVFIGGVPRPTRAKDLAEYLESYYGKVAYVGIDIDPELKYPKGAARVTFQNAASFVSAIIGRFVHIKQSDSDKRVEIKPYVIEDQICDECEGQLCRHSYAPYFCGEPDCLQYYCESCWDRVHYITSETRGDHRPMVRTGDQTKVLSRPPHHLNGGSMYGQGRRFGSSMPQHHNFHHQPPARGQYRPTGTYYHIKTPDQIVNTLTY